MNQWLAACPSAQVAFNELGCGVSLDDLADRPPLPLADGETLDLGGHRLRLLQTPHVPLDVFGAEVAPTPAPPSGWRPSLSTCRSVVSAEVKLS